MNARNLIVLLIIDHSNSIIHYAHNIDMYTYKRTSCGGYF